MQSLNKMHIKYVLHNKFTMITFHDQKALSLNFKSSRSQMFFKIDALNNLAMVTGKHLLLFNIVAGLGDCNCIKKRPQNKSFLVNIAKFLRTFFKFLRTYFHWTSADLFLTKNITWNSFYYEGL